jgi:hypothetical protein
MEVWFSDTRVLGFGGEDMNRAGASHNASFRRKDNGVRKYRQGRDHNMQAVVTL